MDHWTQQSFEKVCKYGEGGNSTDLWLTDAPAYGMNGTYGDYMYVGHAVETIRQHNASTPLFYYLATEVAHVPNETPQRFQDRFDPHTVPFMSAYAMSAIVDDLQAEIGRKSAEIDEYEGGGTFVRRLEGGTATGDERGGELPRQIRPERYDQPAGAVRKVAVSEERERQMALH